MSGQSAMKTRSEVISCLKTLERGPTAPKGGGSKNPNRGSSEGQMVKVPTTQAGK